MLLPNGQGLKLKVIETKSKKCSKHAFQAKGCTNKKRKKKKTLKHIIIHDMHAHLIMQMIHGQITMREILSICVRIKILLKLVITCDLF